ncbi:MAG: DNA repair protein RecO [Wenzhouxiangellaceae bacterium]|nr:DNA repair protein RecO [Wenzhouxiangellaceae bacterium]
MSRVERQPALVLHRRAFRDSSLTLDLLTRDHGRVGAVARAARSARSPMRGLLEPFRLLEVSWTRRGEMATLISAEPCGSAPRLTGRALWCGLYVNELLLRLLPRDAPEPELFRIGLETLERLPERAAQGPALRRFEFALLNALGVAPELDRCAATGDAVIEGARYRFDPVVGPLPSESGNGIPGAALLALANGGTPGEAEARALRPMMRKWIEHQLDGRPLKTPSLFREQAAEEGT